LHPATFTALMGWFGVLALRFLNKRVPLAASITAPRPFPMAGRLSKFVSVLFSMQFLAIIP